MEYTREYKDAHRKYDKAIKYNKRHHWRDWLEKATDPDLWTANKYISSPASDGGKTRIPSLRQQIDRQERTANSNQDKSKMLAETFFLKKPTHAPPTADQGVQGEHPPPVCGTQKISREQILRQLKRLKPFKAPGPDGIPNIMLTKCADILIDRLWIMYNAMLKKELYYTPWSTSQQLY